MKAVIDKEDIVSFLRHEQDRAGSLTALAKDVGVSLSYLSDVCNGRRDPGPVILKYLGLRKRVTYELIDEREV